MKVSSLNHFRPSMTCKDVTTAATKGTYLDEVEHGCCEDQSNCSIVSSKAFRLVLTTNKI